MAWQSATFRDGEGLEIRYRYGTVQMRASEFPDGPYLTFTKKQWTEFLAGAKAGEFDNPVTACPLCGRAMRDDHCGTAMDTCGYRSGDGIGEE